ncbi:hypothetical protein [Demequina activiva]|uniref:Lipoprotein n=1 Tax=Demequina activiva TaxID=1582364 RepID=A0A919Q6S2_9MICO|nr:hypothetical protein [Demequina activiva]GIG55598.1 hypothetical protein Dac01nite_23500 [Demequina activiva]
MKLRKWLVASLLGGAAAVVLAGCVDPAETGTVVSRCDSPLAIYATIEPRQLVSDDFDPEFYRDRAFVSEGHGAVHSIPVPAAAEAIFMTIVFSEDDAEVHYWGEDWDGRSELVIEGDACLPAPDEPAA